jgi:hypothetical protein
LRLCDAVTEEQPFYSHIRLAGTIPDAARPAFLADRAASLARTRPRHAERSA